uniref:PHD-type domain-containing protein n=1 Tax=Oryza rufipogon TaxID=4529 RepID=A0A0E0NK79_ORYRU
MGDAAAASPPASLGKRRRRGGAGGGDGEGLRRVAEIVMVLAAAGEVRGGREPTAAERALAAEARERLAAVVTEGAVRPKDLFPGEAVRALVEDLGLNRARDPAAMGFRPPKASIADRLMLTKRKMEEVKESPVQPTTSTAQTITSSGTADFQGFHGAPKFAVGVPRNLPAVAALPATAPVTSASLVTLKPPGSSPVKSVNNPSVVTMPHTAPSHLKSDKGVNGPPNLVRTGATYGNLNKSFHDTCARSNLNAVQSSNPVAKNQDTKTASIDATAGNPLTGHHATPSVAPVPPKPTFANHSEIAKSVQRVLHQPANHPSWIPPSTEYMRSRLDCQICKVAIMDMESLLVCDACEKGAHLKCLQHYGNKGVPKAEWHCPTCLTKSKGKPLPPKYGKVTRTAVEPKATPPPAGTQVSSQGAAENIAVKENHQKVAVNGNLLNQNSTQAGSVAQSSTVLALGVTAAVAQSQPLSISRLPEGNLNNDAALSSEKTGNVGPCSSIAHRNEKPPDELQSSGLPANSKTGTQSGKSPNEEVSSVLVSGSADSTNDTLHEQKSHEISGEKCSDNSSIVASEANIKSKADSELISGRDVEMVDNDIPPKDQTNNIATEDKPSTQETSEAHKMEVVEVSANTGIQISQGDSAGTEENLHTEVTSVPHMINDVAMATNAGTPICPSNNVAIEEKPKSTVISEVCTTKDTEMTTDATLDQNTNVATEEIPLPESISATEDADMTTDTGIPTNQRQEVNGLAENGRKEHPLGETDKHKSDHSTMPDMSTAPQITSNGVMHSKDEAACGHEGEIVDISAAATEENN